MHIAKRLAILDLLSRATTILIVGALILGWLAMALEVFLGTIRVDPGSRENYIFVSGDVKPVLILRVLSAQAFLLAGLIAMARGEYRRLSVPLRAACWVAALLFGIWLSVGYDAPSLRHLLVGATSPLIWLMPLGLFAGMRRELWPDLYPVIRLLAYASTALGLLTFFTIDIQHYARFNGISPQVIYANVLFWFGAFLLLKPGDSTRHSSPVRLLPLVVCLMLALISQSRGWTLLCVLIMGGRLFGATDSSSSRSKRRHPSWWQLSWFVLLITAAGWFFAERFSPGVSGLKERLTEDSRSAEYVMFFSQVRLEDLILGKGPNASYDRNGEESQFLDNQFLWILFIGGVPALVCYSSLILWPGVRPYLLRQPSRHRVLGIVLMLWALAMAGISTYFGIGTSVENLLIILLAGKCHDDWISTRAELKGRRSSSRTHAEGREPDLLTAPCFGGLAIIRSQSGLVLSAQDGRNELPWVNHHAPRGFPAEM